MAVDQQCLLKILRNDNLSKFLHACVDELIGRSDELIDSYGGDVEWTKPEHQTARNLIKNLYKTAAKKNEDLQVNFSELSPTDIAEINFCYKARKEDICRALVKERLLNTGLPLVENIDWKVKWVLGSSKISSMSEPVVQVDLHRHNLKTQTTTFEMNLDVLNKFISELELAKSNL